MQGGGNVMPVITNNPGLLNREFTEAARTGRLVGAHKDEAAYSMADAAL